MPSPCGPPKEIRKITKHGSCLDCIYSRDVREFTLERLVVFLQLLFWDLMDNMTEKPFPWRYLEVLTGTSC